MKIVFRNSLFKNIYGGDLTRYEISVGNLHIYKKNVFYIKVTITIFNSATLYTW